MARRLYKPRVEQKEIGHLKLTYKFTKIVIISANFWILIFSTMILNCNYC